MISSKTTGHTPWAYTVWSAWREKDQNSQVITPEMSDEKSVFFKAHIADDGVCVPASVWFTKIPALSWKTGIDFLPNNTFQLLKYALLYRAE